MARSSILGADKAATRATGRDLDTLGPSDSSDTGSDVQGVFELDDDGQFDTLAGATQPGLDSASDGGGTGERGAARIDEQAQDAADILPDQVQRVPVRALRELDDADALGDDDAVEGDAALDDATDVERAALMAEDESEPDDDDGEAEG